VKRLALPLALALASLVWLLPAAALADIKLEVRTDRTQLGLEDTLTLRVTVQAEGMGSPDITLPNFDGFEIVSQQVQRPMQFSFSFGARTTVQSSTIYTYSLQPTRAGTLTIKPVRVELDGEVKTSQPLRITVSGAGAAPPAASQPDPDPQDDTDTDDAQPPASPPTRSAEGVENTQIDPVAFVRTVVDRIDPYVGQQVTVTMYLYVRERLSSAPAIRKEPTTDGLWIHDLLTPDRQPQASRQAVNGAVFTVYPMRRFAAFPLAAGDVTIGPLAVDIDTSSPFDIFNPTRRNTQLERTGLPTTLKVKALPEAGRPAGEVAVGRFEVDAKLDRAQAATGDAVTLTATVRGQGNVRTAQLVLAPVAGIDALTPEIKDLVEAPNDYVGGTREYRFLLVPRTPGHFALPALTLQTFDPVAGAYVTKRGPALALDVVGNALPTDPAQAAAQPTEKGAAPGGGAQPTAADAPHTWAPIRTSSALVRGQSAALAPGSFGLLLLAPPLLWLGVVLSSLLRRRAAAKAATPEGRALGEAEHHLSDATRAAEAGDQAAFHSRSSAALLAVLEARLGEPVTGLARGQLERLLENRGLPQATRRELMHCLELSDLARFGAASGDLPALNAQLSALRTLYAALLSFAPKEAA